MGGIPDFLGGVPGFLEGVPEFLGGCSWFSWGCSGFWGAVPGFWGAVPGFWVFRDVPGCSGVPCSGVLVFLEVLHALENGLYYADNVRVHASYMLCSTTRKST